MASGRLGLEVGRSGAVVLMLFCSHALTRRNTGLAFPVASAVATGDVSYERGPRGPAAFRRVKRRGESAMRMLLI
jgi:hypothetical protein